MGFSTNAFRQYPKRNNADAAVKEANGLNLGNGSRYWDEWVCGFWKFGREGSDEGVVEEEALMEEDSGGVGGDRKCEEMDLRSDGQ